MRMGDGQRYELPLRDEAGFCNILMSALGGEGANMAAKLVFKIGCGEFGLDGGYDARYGSEKKGTATDVCVRFCAAGMPVRQAGPAKRRHVLVVFHEDLIAPLDLFRGLMPGAVCIVNTLHTPQVVRDELRLGSGRVVCIDATRIAAESRSRLNMPLLAALCHELKFPDQLVRDRIAKQWPRAAASNLAAFDRAVAECVAATFADDGKHPASGRDGKNSYAGRELGWRNMLNGGTVDALTHTTAGRDNRIAAGGRVPRFVSEACNSCGICLTVCSDPGGLLWREGRMVGIDDAFCKGCMRCVEVCPPNKKGHALNMG